VRLDQRSDDHQPTLADLQFLADAWDMELSDASFLPDPDAKMHGSVTF